MNSYSQTDHKFFVIVSFRWQICAFFSKIGMVKSGGRGSNLQNVIMWSKCQWLTIMHVFGRIHWKIYLQKLKSFHTDWGRESLMTKYGSPNPLLLRESKLNKQLLQGNNVFFSQLTQQIADKYFVWEVIAWYIFLFSWKTFACKMGLMIFFCPWKSKQTIAMQYFL